MAAIAPISTTTIANSAAQLATTSATVGADTTWSPDGKIAEGVHKWSVRSGGVPVLFPAFTLGFRNPQKGSEIIKVMAKLVLPTGNTVGNAYNGITPGPSIAYNHTVIVDFMLPTRGTAAERAAMFSHLVSLLHAVVVASDGSPADNTGTPIRAAVVDLDQPYG